MMIIVLSILFLMSVQPLIMVVMLIFITLMYSVYSYMMMGSFWFSYILIMVMLSGVLVVFTYMVSLIPNESFEVFSLMMVLIFVIVNFEKGFMKYSEDQGFVTLNLWISYIGVFNLFLVFFLLSMMIMVVWLSWLSKGAIRGE